MPLFFKQVEPPQVEGNVTQFLDESLSSLDPNADPEVSVNQISSMTSVLNHFSTDDGELTKVYMKVKYQTTMNFLLVIQEFLSVLFPRQKDG